MQYSEQALQLIREFEGFSAAMYVCPAGFRTIGYGHTLRKGEAGIVRVNKAEAEELLHKDATIAAGAVRRWVTQPLAQHQFDALTSFVFNIGAGAFARSTVRKVINRGWHPEVPEQLKRWVFSGGRLMPGLVRRREAEGELYRGKPA